MARNEHDDDAPIGRLLTRREALALFGLTAGSAFLAACVPGVLSSAGGGTASPGSSRTATLPSCVVRPELTEGPYFVDEKLNRSDIRSDPSTGAISGGAPLALSFLVSRVSGSSCQPFPNALVDIWHCNALGVYSDVNGPDGSTVGQKFLRGYQATDANGAAAFQTIYPGWYSGRAVHIHFKIRSEPHAASGLELTSQLFFDDHMSDTVYARDPYAGKGPHNTPNAADSIYQQSGGQTLLTVTSQGDGYAATFEIGVVHA
jgi:protocatechuate 3,4-dioxygenase beta subunit